MALYSEEMEKNALLQRETRDKSEKIDELQRKYENEKSALQRNVEDLKKTSQEKCEVVGVTKLFLILAAQCLFWVSGL